MQPAGSSPNAQEIRAKAAEILARDDYDLEVHGHEGTWLWELLSTILKWVIAPFEWIYERTAGLPDALRWVILLVLIGLLLLVVWHLAYSIVQAVRGDSRKLQSLAAARRREIDPAELEEEAADAGRRGDYVTALRRLFRAAVIRLERSDERPLRPGTTNRGLLRRYGDRPTVGDALRLFVDMVDRKWYGDEPCSEAEYVACVTAHRDVCRSIRGGTHERAA